MHNIFLVRKNKLNKPLNFKSKFKIPNNRNIKSLKLYFETSNSNKNLFTPTKSKPKNISQPKNIFYSSKNTSIPSKTLYNNLKKKKPLSLVFSPTNSDSNSNSSRYKKFLTMSDKIKLNQILKYFKKNESAIYELFRTEKQHPLNNVNESNYLFLTLSDQQQNYKKYKKNNLKFINRKKFAKSTSNFFPLTMIEKFNNKTHKFLGLRHPLNAKFSKNVFQYRKQLINNFTEPDNRLNMGSVDYFKEKFNEALDILDKRKESTIEKMFLSEKKFYKLKNKEVNFAEFDINNNKIEDNEIKQQNSSKNNNNKNQGKRMSQIMNLNFNLIDQIENKNDLKEKNDKNINNNVNENVTDINNNNENKIFKKRSSVVFKKNNSSKYNAFPGRKFSINILRHSISKKLNEASEENNIIDRYNKNNINIIKDKKISNYNICNDNNKYYNLNNITPAYKNNEKKNVNNIKKPKKPLSKLEKQIIKLHESHNDFLNKKINERSEKLANSMAKMIFFQGNKNKYLTVNNSKLNINSMNLMRVIKLMQINKYMNDVEDDELLENAKKLRGEINDTENQYYTCNKNSKLQLSYLKKNLKPKTIKKFCTIKNSFFGLPC